MAEGLDIEREAELLAYLRATGRVGIDELVEVRVLAGGVSNRTVWVKRASGECWVLKQALAKLRVKVDWFSDPRRVEREALGLHWLAKLAPVGTITPLVFEDREKHLLAMEAVPEPHENWKTMLLRGEVKTNHIDQFAGILGSIHRRAAELSELLREVFDDRSFFESLRLEPYYQYTASQAPAAADFLNRLVADTRARRLTIVHGDYSPKNILVHDGKLILLDHEVIHWGDPAFDIGFAMAHLLSKAHHLRAHRERFAKAAARFMETYASKPGPLYWDDNLQARAVRHTAACLLARVAGRSPLEYLEEIERRRQQDVVVRLIQRPLGTLTELIEAFILGVNLGEGEEGLGS